MVIGILLETIGLELDQSKFIISQVMALLAGLAFRHFLPANTTNVIKRHLVATILGLYLGYFVFDKDFLHLLIISTLCFGLMKTCPRYCVHILVLVFVMIYLSFVHLYYQINYYGQKNFDITSPMMIFVQKLTYIAFSYADGSKSSDKLNEHQKSYALKSFPGILEFYSYLFHFQGVVVGPGCNFKDYIEFIDGTNIRKHQNDSTLKCPSVKKALFKKILITVLMIILFLKFTLKYPFVSYLDPDVLAKPLWFRLFYLHLASKGHHLYYYIPWTLSDAVNNASGFGFNGYDEKGEPKWDLLTNINIYELETSTSLKYTIDNWHIQTKNWLRRIFFDRLPKGKTLGVFMVSCIWHGFYPGYYFSFVFSAFVIYVGRGIRRTLRPFCLKNQILTQLYAGITYTVTQITIAYIIVPFFVLTAESSIKFYNSLYWIGHLLTLILIIILPKQSFKSKSS